MTTLSQLRAILRTHALDFYYVPATDPHQNEYVPGSYQRRTFITGFTGSAGDALIGLEFAGLWTDGRYFLQAARELNPAEFTLMRQGEAPTLEAWLKEHGHPGMRIGVDSRVLSLTQAERFLDALKPHQGVLVATPENLIDGLWTDRPPLPTGTVWEHPLTYAGLHAAEKIQQLRLHLAQHHAAAIAINRLDHIAWLFNIRSNSIPYQPTVLSQALITATQAIWYIDTPYLDDTLRHYCEVQHIEIAPYDTLCNDLTHCKGTVWLDPIETTWAIAEAVPSERRLLQTSPITLKKAVKNEAEKRGMQDAHVQDGIAMVRFLHWLETKRPSLLTEIDAATQLEQFRRDNALCVDLSFPTISGFGEHGAIIHYSATAETNAVIKTDALYLLDSGGQYVNGTTDVTRTIHLGAPTAEEKRFYTRVLQGHIALGNYHFPHGTAGEHLDALARLPLWQEHCDYNHGTGHGVGAFLYVHEGPQSISKRPSQVPLLPGMMVSNEPGVYIPGRFGIRIENVCVVEAIEDTTSATGHGPFYQLIDLTVVPYARNLMDCSLLSRQEIAWINAYHAHVYNTLQPYLTGPVLHWLEQATQALS
ncbi:MAG: hypothetical protein A3J38_09850 [Gammaproteobacteria bacterium RIFCSPHIGHO2_12_FULL_45_9]|nr:MAG: hypothetical protein A3J38_09850 [Gammaproteobacteria bacterium RIFCSPHIGHO2_12_FULL_45_9]